MYTLKCRPFSDMRRYVVKFTLALACFALVFAFGHRLPQRISMATTHANTLKKIRREHKRCFGLYRKKQFPKAIACYKALRKLNRNAQYLVNIAQSYRLEARKTAKKPEADVLREQAISVFKQYKKEAPHANFWTNKMIQKLEKAVGYAQFKAATSPTKAQYVIKGHKFVRSGTMPVSLKLRPGKYTLDLSAESHKPKQVAFEIKPTKASELKIMLKPVAKKVILTRATPVPRPIEPKPTTKGSAGVLPWIAVAAGGALVVAGIVFVGLGAGASGALDNPDTPAKQAQDALYQRGWQMPVGGTLIALGAAAGITGIVLFFVGKKKSPPNTPNTPPAKSTSAHIQLQLP